MFKKTSYIAPIFLSACAATYHPPQLQPIDFVQSMRGTQAEIMRKAKITLAANGYQITSSDADSGLITTAPHDQHLTPAQADCGSTMGIDYLKDKRTSTRTAINIIAANNSLQIKAIIQGEYKPGSADQDITLTCISRGYIEQQIFTEIETR